MPTPFIWSGNLTVKHGILRLGLIINTVKPTDILEELMEVGVGAGVNGGLEQRLEQTLEDVLKVVHTVVNPVNVVQTRNLDQPPEHTDEVNNLLQTVSPVVF